MPTISIFFGFVVQMYWRDHPPPHVHVLYQEFSNGRTGIRDLTDVLTEGGEMVEPLREPAFFKKVFVSCGVPTWPNGFDLDAINLCMELDQAGQLTPARELEGASDPRLPLREYE